jgi:hypothetical protein
LLDPQGAAAPGATVSVRQTDTNVTVEAITEADGRFRFPYLKVGPYELEAKLQGFTDHARSQIAGTVPQAEIQTLPMNGRNSQTGVVSITSENIATINARLTRVGYQGLPVETGLYPNPVHSSHLLGKIDHHVTSDNARGVGNLNAPSGSTGLDNRDHSLAISNVWMLSSNTVSETRVQMAHGDLQAYSTDQVGPQVTISGVAAFGTFSSSPTRRENTLYQDEWRASSRLTLNLRANSSAKVE